MIYLILTILMWSIGPVFVRTFANHTDSWTQNAFRYSCAAVALLAFSGVTGRLRARLSAEQWRRIGLVAAANLVMQSLFAATFYFIDPAVASLVHRFSILSTVGLAYLVFHDERETIRSPRFLAGAGLVVAGVLIVVLGRDAELLRARDVSERAFWIGVGLAAAFAVAAAGYALTIKHAMRAIGPLVCFTHVSWITSLGLVALMLAFGHPTQLLHVPLDVLGWMVVSALVCIFIAHTLYYAALRHVKAAVAASVLQTLPLFTGLASFVFLGERLAPWQLIGGVVVIGGAVLAASTTPVNRSSRQTPRT